LSRGFDSLKDALRRVTAEVHLISFKNDLLFRNTEMKELADELATIRKINYTYVDIDSDYGHDAFLVELDKFENYIKEALHG